MSNLIAGRAFPELGNVQQDLARVGALVNMAMQYSGDEGLDDTPTKELDYFNCFDFASESLDKSSNAIQSLADSLTSASKEDEYSIRVLSNIALQARYVQNYFLLLAEMAGSNSHDRPAAIGLAQMLIELTLDDVRRVVGEDSI